MKDRQFLVTGASSGIGRAVCLRLLGQGAAVEGLGRRPAGELDDDLAGHARFRYRSCDLGDFQGLERVMDEVIGHGPPIHGVVMSHGYGDFGSLEEFSARRIRAMVDVNLVSYALILRRLMPLLRKQGAGSIIVIGSEAALRGGRRGAMYCATKFALRGLVQSLRQECAGSGVAVSIVNPGMVKSPFFDRVDFSPGDSRDNYLLPEDVAMQVERILEMPPGSVVDEVNLSPLKRVAQRKGD